MQARFDHRQPSLERLHYATKREMGTTLGIERHLRMALLMATLLMSGCASTQAHQPAAQLPAGVDGYQCYRRANFPGGFVYAEGYPDYRGGYASLTHAWHLDPPSGMEPEIFLGWHDGDNTWLPALRLNVSQAVRPLPPLGTQISLRLSSGEWVQQDLISEHFWRLWQYGPANSAYGGFVETRDPAFISAFGAIQEPLLVGPTCRVGPGRTRPDKPAPSIRKLLLYRLIDSPSPFMLHWTLPHCCETYHALFGPFNLVCHGRKDLVEQKNLTDHNR